MFLIPETPISRWNRSKGAYYDGNVQSYDHDTGKHLVVFDDGEEREYSMDAKTFKVLDARTKKAVRMYRYEKRR